MHLVTSAEARTFHFLGLAQQTLAGPETGLSTVEVWRITLKPRGESPPYQHPGETVWVILQGSGQAVVDGEVAQVGPGTAVSIPAGASRQLVNTGDVELVLLTVRGAPVSGSAGEDRPVC
ncbi:MAG: cupin domain-containing protein [Syntrophobacterales bacterium]|nr:cupin domain-containing protein [Syntrophobacterales bacterium]